MQPQTDEQRLKRPCPLAGHRKVQQIAGRTGLLPWFRGAQAPELIPLVRNMPKQRVLLGGGIASLSHVNWRP